MNSQSMRRNRVALSLALVVASSWSASVALARDTDVNISAQEVIQSEHGKSFLIGIPIYLKGAKRPAIAKELSVVTTEQSTRGAFRSDDASCRVAFLSAALILQERAQEKGADAIVDVVSITRRVTSESETTFRCVAGTFVVHVGLKGKIVRLEE